MRDEGVVFALHWIEQIAIQLRTFARSPPTLRKRMINRGSERERDGERADLDSRLFTALPVAVFHLFPLKVTLEELNFLYCLLPLSNKKRPLGLAHHTTDVVSHSLENWNPK